MAFLKPLAYILLCYIGKNTVNISRTLVHKADSLTQLISRYSSKIALKLDPRLARTKVYRNEHRKCLCSPRPPNHFNLVQIRLRLRADNLLRRVVVLNKFVI